jgi:hypothetical protein
MKFLDKAKINIKAGDGGNGSHAMQSETKRCAILTSRVISGEFRCSSKIARPTRE